MGRKAYGERERKDNEKKSTLRKYPQKIRRERNVKKRKYDRNIKKMHSNKKKNSFCDVGLVSFTVG